MISLKIHYQMSDFGSRHYIVSDFCITHVYSVKVQNTGTYSLIAITIVLTHFLNNKNIKAVKTFHSTSSTNLQLYQLVVCTYTNLSKIPIFIIFALFSFGVSLSCFFSFIGNGSSIDGMSALYASSSHLEHSYVETQEEQIVS